MKGFKSANGFHRFVEKTPVRTVDLRIVDAILADNAAIASREQRARKVSK